MEENIEELKQKYPSVSLAYKIALKSYDWAIQRYDAVDSRIDRMLAWISSITIGVIAIVASKEQVNYFYSWWFCIAILFFLVSLGFIISGKLKGQLKLITPTKLYEKYLHLDNWEFKKNIIQFAGEGFKHNIDWVNFKGRNLKIGMVFFLFEIIALSLWLFLWNRFC